KARLNWRAGVSPHFLHFFIDGVRSGWQFCTVPRQLALDGGRFIIRGVPRNQVFCSRNGTDLFTFSYDANNWMTQMSDAIGRTTFTYTPAGQLASETGPWGSDTISYTYSDRLRTGLDLQQPNAAAWVESYCYDAANRL